MNLSILIPWFLKTFYINEIVMGKYVCLVFCFLCVDSVIGIKSGDQGVCAGPKKEKVWVVFSHLNQNTFLNFEDKYSYHRWV